MQILLTIVFIAILLNVRIYLAWLHANRRYKTYKCIGLLMLLCLCTYAPCARADGSGLVINEIQVANIDLFTDPSYNYGGWIELYNSGDESVWLSGLKVRHTDSDGNVDTYTLNAMHGNVQAHGFHNLWFDHNSQDGNYGNNASTQVRFKLDAEGGIIEIVGRDGTTIDALNYPPAMSRCSYARMEDGGTMWSWTSEPTPSMSNSLSEFADERVDAPQVDTGGTLFNSQINFKVDIPNCATLYYTTDGSTPTKKHGIVSADGVFSTDKTTIYRFILTKQGMLNSEVVTRSFIKNDRGYYLPVLSVSSHPDNFFNDTIGVYVTGTNGKIGNNQKTKCNQNMDWERPVCMEYMEPDEQSGEYVTKLNEECAFSIFGGWSRFNHGDDFWEYKSSFKLNADKQYGGRGFFPYAVFDSKPYIKLKTLLVRNGGQDQYARIWDAALQEIIRTSGFYIDSQAWQPCHVFLDGHYLGMLNLREASNKKFAYSNYGIDGDEIDQWEDDIIVKAGTLEKINKWYELATTLASSPSDTATWNRIQEILDVDEYCNYMAAEIFMGNADWIRSGLKNIKGFNAKDGKIHIVMYDLDGCFASDSNTAIVDKLQTVNSKLVKTFRNMLTYEPFRKQFIDAYCLVSGSVFDPTRCKPIIDTMTETITAALAIEGNSPVEKVQKLYGRIADKEGFHTAAINNLKETFEITDDEYTMQISSNTNQCRLLLNGQEIPENFFDGVLFPHISLKAFAPNNYRFVGWEVNGSIECTDTVFNLDEQFGADNYTVKAVFTLMESTANTLPPIRVNEVSSKNDIYINDYMNKSDWLELYNMTDKEVDITGMYLSDDRNNPEKYRISADGDASSVIPAYGYKVVWCDGRNGISELHTPFKLGNSDGEYISLTAGDGSWTDSLVYRAQKRWQTFGRYPDGSDNVALFNRITIGQSNHTLTSTELTYVASNDETDLVEQIAMDDAQIVDVQYYNLQGQRITDPGNEHIVIQKIIYSNGYTKTRKVAHVRY